MLLEWSGYPLSRGFLCNPVRRKRTVGKRERATGTGRQGSAALGLAARATALGVLLLLTAVASANAQLPVDVPTIPPVAPAPVATPATPAVAPAPVATPATPPVAPGRSRLLRLLRWRPRRSRLLRLLRWRPRRSRHRDSGRHAVPTRAERRAGARRCRARAECSVRAPGRALSASGRRETPAPKVDLPEAEVREVLPLRSDELPPAPLPDPVKSVVEDVTGRR